MPESGSTIPLVNVTTSGGYGASVPTYVASTSSGAFAGVPVVNVTTSGGLGAASLTVNVTTSGGAFAGVPAVVVTTSGGLGAASLSVTSTSVALSTATPNLVTAASSGLTQISGTVAVTSTSVALSTGAANLVTVASSAGLTQTLVMTSTSVALSTGAANLVTVASSAGLTQTVTILSASSGLVQISGPVLLSTASGFGAIGTIRSLSSGTVSTLSSGAILLSSAGLTQISGPVQVNISSSGFIAPKFITATSVQNITSSASALWYLSGFTTAPAGAVIRLYNATTSNVVLNTSVVAAFLVGSQSTASAQWAPNLVESLRPLNFATACSFDVVVTVTSTLAVAGNTYVTAMAI